MIGEKASDLIKGKDTVKDFRDKVKHLKLWFFKHFTILFLYLRETFFLY
jgi:hypothetical protein